MGDLLQSGPSPQKKEAELVEFAESLPPDRLTRATVMRKAIELGFRDPVRGADWALKGLDTDRKRMKESMPDPTQLPAGTVPVTAQILELLSQANLPTTGLSEPAPLPTPLGRNAGTGMPLSLPDLASLVPQIGEAIAQNRLPGPVVGSQPELSLFGKPALDALPQQPAPGAFVPAPVVTEAAGRAGKPPAGPLANMSEVELSVLAAQGNPLAKRVLEDIQRRRVEVSAQQGFFKESLSRQLPLSPTERENLIHPETLAAAPPGLTEQQAIEKGYIKANPQQLQKLGDIEQTQSLVDFLSGLARINITAENPTDALMQGVRLTTGAIAKTNPAAAAYQDSKQAFLGVISRNLGGERGVLTDRDIGRVDGMLPGFRDTVTIREFKIQMIQTLIDSAREQQKRVILGKSIEEARKATQQQVDKIFKLFEQNLPKTEQSEEKQGLMKKYGVD